VKIDPELRQRLNPWDWLVLVVAVVSLLLVILETFLQIPPAVLSVLRTVDTLSCLVFLADVFVRWRREKYAVSYWRWAWIDVLASIPFEPAFRSLQAIRIYRFIRLIRILKKLSTLTSGTSLNEKLLPGHRRRPADRLGADAGGHRPLRFDVRHRDLEADPPQGDARPRGTPQGDPRTACGNPGTPPTPA
jgi:hypothetical protein